MSSITHNPITHRLEQLVDLWRDFASDDNARVCHWVLEADEVTMVDAFVQVENANEARTDDLFIRLRSPFHSSEQYSLALLEELAAEWEAYQQFIPKKALPLQWSLQLPSQPIQAQHFVDSFAQFALQTPDFEGLAVAVLTPDELYDPTVFSEWLAEALKGNFSTQIRFMIIDLEANQHFTTLATRFPTKVRSIAPQLDMPAAMEEIAATGDPNDPGVQYRQLYVKVTQCISTGQLEKMEQLGQSGIAIAISQEWNYLAVSMYLALASGYIGRSQPHTAIERYDQGIQIADAGWQAEDPLCTKLLIQALLSKGSVLYGNSNYEEAAAVYEQAVAPAITLADNMSMLEAWRMAAFCHEQNQAYDAAWEANQKALQAGSELPEDIPPHTTTLPYVGTALLRLLEPLDRQPKEQTIRGQLKALCGPNWEPDHQNQAATH